MKKLVITVTAVLLSAVSIIASTLSVDECVSLARAHYPAVAQYGLLEKVAQLNMSEMSKKWLPQGSVSGQVSWQNSVAALPDALTAMLIQQGVEYPGLGKTQYRVGVDVSQQIWDGGQVKAGRRAVEAAAEVERNGLDVEMYDVEGRVEEIYFSILLCDSRLARADKSIALMDSTLHQVEAMYANGVAMKSDCNQIEATLLGLDQQKAQLAATRGSLVRVLEVFIGEPVGERILVLPSEDALDVSACNHPNLKLFDARLRSVDSQEAGINASVMPNVGAFVSGYYGYPGYDMFKNMQSRDWSFNIMAGIKVSWNFGALYTRKSSLSKLQLQRDKIESERHVFEFNNSMVETESLGKISALRSVRMNDERILALRRSVVNAAQSQLRNGVIDTTALLAKITDEELAENDMSLHTIELIKALYNLNHIRNR